jgi:hypothetical protein
MSGHGTWDDIASGFDFTKWGQPGGGFGQAGQDIARTPKSVGDFFGQGGKDIARQVNSTANDLGLIPKTVDPNAPGASLDTTQSDMERQQQLNLLGQLFGQAAGRGYMPGAAQLKAGSDATQGAIQAVGQSQPGAGSIGYGSQLRNILDAQANAKQVGAGQANILRNQGELNAQNQLGSALGGMGATDLNQAEAAQQANAGVRALNVALAQNAQKNVGNIAGSFSQAASVAGSNGGDVPGEATFGGNDPRNDTVKARLSPGEYVIDRESMKDPDVRAFVEALKARKGETRHSRTHFDGGGTAGGLTNGDAQQIMNNMNWGSFALNPVAEIQKAEGAGVQDPTIQNGGMLDTTRLNRDQAYGQDLAATLNNRIAGNGPSVAPQEFQNAQDASILAAMQPGARGPGRAGDALQQAAGRAADTSAAEMAGGTSSLESLLGNMRNRELGTAQAQQKAEFGNTQMNAGLDLASQAQLRAILGGEGQAATQMATMNWGGNSAAPNMAGINDNLNAATSSFSPGDMSSPSDWNQYGGSGGGIDTGEGAAYGGEIEPEDDFVKALKKGNGKKSGFMRMVETHKKHARRIKELERTVAALK